MQYSAYLKSPEWRVVRRLALGHAHYRCQVCNRRDALEVHHRTYERIGRELLSDVSVLCAECHGHFHGREPSSDYRHHPGNQLALMT
jgi:predicted HNH restriction endonuclease